MKKQIMKRAWEIRRAAAEKFNCKCSEICFSSCLKLAWEESRMENETIIAVRKRIQEEIEKTKRESIIAVNEEMLKILEIKEVQEEIQEETAERAFQMLYKIFKKMTGYKPGKGFTPIN